MLKGLQKTEMPSTVLYGIGEGEWCAQEPLWMERVEPKLVAAPGSGVNGWMCAAKHSQMYYHFHI